MRDSDALQPGRVGGGVFPNSRTAATCRSRPCGWEDVDRRINNAVFAGLLAYLRKYPQRSSRR
jgi:hypothetical protein